MLFITSDKVNLIKQVARVPPPTIRIDGILIKAPRLPPKKIEITISIMPTSSPAIVPISMY